MGTERRNVLAAFGRWQGFLELVLLWKPLTSETPKEFQEEFPKTLLA